MKVDYKVTFFHVQYFQDGRSPAVKETSHKFGERSSAVDWIVKTQNDFAARGYTVNKLGDFTDGKEILRYLIEREEAA